MAEAAAHGVVGPHGEVFGNRNLFVPDGAIVSAALGVNPSLTIAAVAELACDPVIRGASTESLAGRLG